MIRDMKINDKHTRNHWNLVLTTHPVPAQPSPNIYTIDIPGGNGYIDLTQSLIGETTYGAREGSWAFTMLCDANQAATQYSAISKEWHGQNCTIVLDDDTNYYYEGILSVGPLALFGNHGAFNVSYKLYPFKRKKTTTDVTVNFAQTTSRTAHTMNFRDVSGMWTNTDLINYNGVSFASATNVYINVPDNGRKVSSYSRITYQFVDNKGKVFQNQKEYSALPGTIGWTGDGFRTLCTNNGVDYSNIVRVLITGWGGCNVGIRDNVSIAHVNGGDCSIIPEITLPTSGITVICNDKAFSNLPSGKQVIDGLVIPKGGTDIAMYKAGLSSGTATITYREELL